MEHVLRNVLMAFLEQRSATMHDILRILSEKDFRRQTARYLKNEPVRRLAGISSRLALFRPEAQLQLRGSCTIPPQLPLILLCVHHLSYPRTIYRGCQRRHLT
ncbi:hypothetical protein EAS62_37485 [Bradyrhizobium zhanjiangense]|uniref:Uncharacterized protein n=1 Tax=Bradyrhizobium zhanjiangense TaxID=1325107 RepID=A0ABY0DAS7_9BRAD|nr:hypothetical protein EAS62_37485 [Bradyrhizobium zhanjiangense]